MKIVFDLDGTLADTEHRTHLAVAKNWKAYFDACALDTVIQEIAEINAVLATLGHRVEIWTGRSDGVRELTRQWLDDQDIFTYDLKMRPAQDHRPDYVIKEEWLHALPKEEWPELVFEDRQQVVDMWRRNGIRCCQVAKGDF